MTQPRRRLSRKSEERIRRRRPAGVRRSATRSPLPERRLRRRTATRAQTGVSRLDYYLVFVTLALAPVGRPLASQVRETDRTAWDPENRWLDLWTTKAVRRSGSPGIWDLLVSADHGHTWTYRGRIRELHSLAIPHPPAGLLHGLGRLEQTLLVGEVTAEDGGSIFVAGAVSDLGERFSDDVGTQVSLFVPIFLHRERDEVDRFADTYVVLYRELWES